MDAIDFWVGLQVLFALTGSATAGLLLLLFWKEGSLSGKSVAVLCLFLPVIFSSLIALVLGVAEWSTPFGVNKFIWGMLLSEAFFLVGILLQRRFSPIPNRQTPQ